MKRIQYEAVNLTILLGQTSTDQQKSLLAGICVGVTFYPFNTIPSQNINLGVESPQGDRIITSVDVRDYERGKGEYLTSYKQTRFQTTGNNVVVRMTTGTPLAADFSGQLVFAIEIE